MESIYPKGKNQHPWHHEHAYDQGEFLQTMRWQLRKVVMMWQLDGDSVVFMFSDFLQIAEFAKYFSAKSSAFTAMKPELPFPPTNTSSDWIVTAGQWCTCTYSTYSICSTYLIAVLVSYPGIGATRTADGCNSNEKTTLTGHSHKQVIVEVISQSL